MLRGNPFFLLFCVVSNYEPDSVHASLLLHAKRRNIKLMIEMDKQSIVEIRSINNFILNFNQKFRSQKFINYILINL